MNNTSNGAGIFIIYNAAGVSEMFHADIVAAVRAGGTLPEELSDILTLTPVEVDGETRWRVDFA